MSLRGDRMASLGQADGLEPGQGLVQFVGQKGRLKPLALARHERSSFSSCGNRVRARCAEPGPKHSTWRMPKCRTPAAKMSEAKAGPGSTPAGKGDGPEQRGALASPGTKARTETACATGVCRAAHVIGQGRVGDDHTWRAADATRQAAPRPSGHSGGAGGSTGCRLGLRCGCGGTVSAWASAMKHIEIRARSPRSFLLLAKSGCWLLG